IADASEAARATKLQPRLRAAAGDSETAGAGRRASGAPAPAGRQRGSRYSLPGQSGIIYRDPAEDTATQDPLPPDSSPETHGPHQPGTSGTGRRTTLGPAPSSLTGQQTAVPPADERARTTARRRITSARPVRAEDRALVAATTQVLQSIEVVQ